MDDCDRQRPCSNCKATGIDVQGCVGTDHDSRRHVGAGPTKYPTNNDTGHRSDPEVQPVSTNRDPGMPRHNADKSGSSDGNNARASLGKRKRKPNDTGTETGHGEVQKESVPGRSVPSKRQATGSFLKDNSSDRQRRPAVSLPEGTTSNAPDGNTTTHAHGTSGSDLSEIDLGRMWEEQARKKPDFDLGAFLDQMTDLKRSAEHGAIAIIACIGDIHNTMCPLDPEPSEQLSALYVRCFVADWEDKSPKLRKLGGFRIVKNTISLISAFLYDKIISKPACKKDVAQDLMAQLQASGPTGRSILQALDWPKRGKSGLECS